MDAMRHISKEHYLVNQLAEQFKVPTEQLPERIEGVVTRLRDAEKELKELRISQVLQSAGDLADRGGDVRGVTLVAEQVPEGVDGNALRALVGEVRGRLGSRPAVVALFSPDTEADKVNFVVGANEAAQDKGLAAGKLVPAFAGEVGGRGGGKPDMAQGGGSEPSGVTSAIAALRKELDRVVSQG
jgi:alanyl-tRNA synthetase